ncbi:Os01g0123500 [Oryza sativa Japonica Group]|uniref:Os01g0123500 protein n=1 Tax=Oryza sativa subsp. japonica TaxID=39947 RepID=A0A0P0UXE9_ORYSJ|nr:hypothetical protein EE612_004190 [Oryza sativa]BAS70151.1 Os01g0123500 [Oryza sativa Japonica Group]
MRLTRLGMMKKNGKRTTMDHGTAKKTRSVKVAKKTEAGLCTDQQQDVEEETTKMTYSIDSDSLECGICFLPFEDRVYMCKNGHAACGSCCVVMDGQGMPELQRAHRRHPVPAAGEGARSHVRSLQVQGERMHGDCWLHREAQP